MCDFFFNERVCVESNVYIWMRGLIYLVECGGFLKKEYY